MRNAQATTKGRRTKKSPSFQFYAGDFISDEAVRLMSNDECGLYIRLLCHCWLERSIPSDLASIAKLTSTPMDETKRLWPAVRKCFKKDSKSGRLVHSRLNAERMKQRKYKLTKSKAGSLGALQRWGLSDRSAIVLPLAKNSSSSSSSSSISNNVRTNVGKQASKTTGAAPGETLVLSPDRLARLRRRLSEVEFEDGEIEKFSEAQLDSAMQVPSVAFSWLRWLRSDSIGVRIKNPIAVACAGIRDRKYAPGYTEDAVIRELMDVAAS